MKIRMIAFGAAIASACFAQPTLAQQNARTTYRQTGYNISHYDDVAVSPSDAKPPSSGCSCSQPDGSISCDLSGCDSSGCDGLGCSNEPWKLFSGKNCMGLNIAGWSQVGYHTSRNAGGGLLTGTPAPANFNTYDRVQLQQQWIYAEKIADGSNGVGFGGRIDYLYGTDAPDTQAFGINSPGHWDNSWDNGGQYGHAMPQLYGEVAYGATSVKVGHFFTIIGQEVVQATGNFFYSRQFTFYNAEPFTHTGALATTVVDDKTTVWSGYVTGWDSGFRDNGDAYIGGFKQQINDCTSVIYTSALGRFGEVERERGQIHSLILTSNLSDKLTYIGQTDYLFTNDEADVGIRNTFGFINYLIYKLNDKWSVGSRTEWFNYSTEKYGIVNDDLYNQTIGLNYKPIPNLTFRPEYRHVWDKGAHGVNENGGSSQGTFGTDMIFTF